VIAVRVRDTKQSAPAFRVGALQSKFQNCLSSATAKSAILIQLAYQYTARCSVNALEACTKGSSQLLGFNRRSALLLNFWCDGSNRLTVRS
jgi:hypothetical protein